MSDFCDLNRFLLRQEETHNRALSEMRGGRKATHWMWWEMPQLRILGRSQRAHDYGLSDLDEASSYLAHPVLGPRLLELCAALLVHDDLDADEIMGPVDGLKLRSMATLFAAVPGTPDVFDVILQTFFAGQGCDVTGREVER